MSTKPKEFGKVDRALELEVIDWLQWGDEWDENKAALALQLISKRKSAYQALEQKLDAAVEALNHVNDWFDRLEKDHSEKLSKSFEDACKNWGSLSQEPLDLLPIKQALALINADRGEK